MSTCYKKTNKHCRETNIRYTNWCFEKTKYNRISVIRQRYCRIHENGDGDSHKNALLLIEFYIFIHIIKKRITLLYFFIITHK